MRLQCEFHTIGRNDIHFSPDSLFKILFQANKIQQCTALREVNEQIEVTASGLLTARKGTENAYVRDAVPFRNAQNG
jgi:hypothetical protein